MTSGNNDLGSLRRGNTQRVNRNAAYGYCKPGNCPASGPRKLTPSRNLGTTEGRNLPTAQSSAPLSPDISPGRMTILAPACLPHHQHHRHFCTTRGGSLGAAPPDTYKPQDIDSPWSALSDEGSARPQDCDSSVATLEVCHVSAHLTYQLTDTFSIHEQPRRRASNLLPLVADGAAAGN